MKKTLKSWLDWVVRYCICHLKANTSFITSGVCLNKALTVRFTSVLFYLRWHLQDNSVNI